MKSYEERLPLLDKAILEENGQWGGGENDYLITTTDKIVWGVGILCYLPAIQLDPHWEYVGSKEEFMQRKQELQNIPSWDTAPEWAYWLSQDECGEWYWHQGKPTEDSYYYTWESKQKVMYTKHMGEVFGDWKDTLEQRPITHTPTFTWDNNDVVVCSGINTPRTEINAENTDIVMPDGAKFRLLDLLLEHNAIKRHALEQEVAGILQENGHVDAVSVAKMVLDRLGENNNEQQ